MSFDWDRVRGGLLWLRHHPTAAIRVWSISGAVGLLALALPRAAMPFYWLWMGLGFVIGSVMSRVVMAVIFYGILTPLGALFRLRRRDALRLKKGGETYWVQHPKIDDPSYYDHLF